MNEIYITTIITIGIVCLLFFVMPLIYKRFSNIDFTGLFNSANNILKALDTIVDNISIPTNTKTTLDMIIDYSTQAVQYAEQLYKSGQLDKDARKEEAVKYIEDILKLSNIEITDDIEKLINATIESSVLLLPKTEEIE